MLTRMGASWKREVLNLYKVVLGPPGRHGAACSLAPSGTAVAACTDLGMPDGWWSDDTLFVVRPPRPTEFLVYARDNETWANYLINALRMSEEEKLWFDTALLLDCVGG